MEVARVETQKNKDQADELTHISDSESDEGSDTQHHLPFFEDDVVRLTAPYNALKIQILLVQKMDEGAGTMI